MTRQANSDFRTLGFHSGCLVKQKGYMKLLSFIQDSDIENSWLLSCLIRQQ